LFPLQEIGYFPKKNACSNHYRLPQARFLRCLFLQLERSPTSNRACKDEKAKKRSKKYFIDEDVFAVHHAITIAHSDP
jgi:hypothetical protein